MTLPLYAAILPLHALHDVELPAMVGTETHGALLALIQAGAPALSAWLHDDHAQAKPFGVAALPPVSVWRAKRWIIKAGERLDLRLTVGGAPIFETLEALLATPCEIRLGAGWFRTGVLSTDSAANPLAGQSTMAELWRAAQPVSHQKVRFLTPTTWKEGVSGNPYYVLTPDPAGFYKSLSKLWGFFARDDDSGLRYDYRALLAALGEGQVRINAQRSESIHWETAKPPAAGFIGSVRYQIQGEEGFRRLIDVLTRFSFYAGVGNSRARGLGMVAPTAAMRRSEGLVQADAVSR